MSVNVLNLEIENGVAYITINNPKTLNAMDSDILKCLNMAIDTILENDVYALIVKGAGDKAFAAGADIKDLSAMSIDQARDWSRNAQKILNKLARLPVVVIAAINGYALGGGLELAMACDIRVASEKSRFGLPELGLGLIPGFTGTQRLPRIIGTGRALEMMFTGRQIDAEEALRIGLVNEVVNENDLMSFCIGITEKIGLKSQNAIRLCKAAVYEGLEMDIDKAYAHEANLFALSFASNDAREGIAAFLEKRTPHFQR